MRRVSSLPPRARVQREQLGVLTRLADGAQGTIFRTERMQVRRRPALYKRYKPETLSGLDVVALEAMVDHFRDMTPEAGTRLLDIAAWPVSTVLSGAVTDGCLMPQAPRRFDATLHLPSGVTKVRPAHFEQLLNSDQFTRHQLGRPVPDLARVKLLWSVASHLDWLHAHGIVVGDLSPTNLLFSLPTGADPDTYFIDCDAMAVDGVTCLEAVETPDWRVRESYPEEQPATVQSDDFKLALLVLRTLVRDQHKRVAAALPGWASPELRPMLEAGFGPAGDRPEASEWVTVLAGVADDIAAGRITVPASPTGRRSGVLPATRRLTTAPAPVAPARRPAARPQPAFPPTPAPPPPRASIRPAITPAFPQPPIPVPEVETAAPARLDPIAEVRTPDLPVPVLEAAPDPTPPPAPPPAPVSEVMAPLSKEAADDPVSPPPPAPVRARRIWGRLAAPAETPPIPPADAAADPAPARVRRPRQLPPLPEPPESPEPEASDHVVRGPWPTGVLGRARWRRGAIAGLGVTAVAVATLILVLVTGIGVGGLGNGTGAGAGARTTGTPTPRTTPRETPTPAPTPVPGTSLVAGTFSLRFPAGVVVDQNEDDAVSLYQTGTDSGVLIQTVTVAGTTPAALQAQVLASMRSQYGTVGTCVARQPLTVDGVIGVLQGYYYVYPSGGGTPLCNTFWFGTNADGTVEYLFQEFANQSNYAAWDPLALGIRNSITWKV
ncbi:MAG TPA: hypothetical protein VIA06_08795 [Candidatus Dormibacteraeota bacterium]|nr:hypothetical protein [Candidatus Dormibacteraeota bacterium]